MNLLIMRWAVALAVSWAVASPATPPGAVDTSTAVGVEMETWEAESFRIDLPVDWEQEDLSNRTYLSGTPQDVRAHFRQPAPDGEDASVLFRYTAEPAPENPPPARVLEDLIEDGRAAMSAMPSEEFVYFVQDKGHGCMDGFQLLRHPETVPLSGEPGHHIAFDYEYACFSSGDPIRGWAWVAFSPDGRKHNIVLTAREDVWIEEFETLQAVTASLTLPG
jgi:hypothetical protein